MLSNIFSFKIEIEVKIGFFTFPSSQRTPHRAPSDSRCGCSGHWRTMGSSSREQDAFLRETLLSGPQRLS